MTRRVLAVATTTALLGVFAPAASAQELGDVLGTTILNGILTGITLPQVPIPDPELDGTQQTQQTQPQTQTETTPAPVAHAASYYCKGESKRRVRGFKNTPFSSCVKAMRQLQNGSASSPAEACASVTRRRFPGMKRTPFAVCVAGGRALLADRQ
jgi:hypothetical protein